GQGAGAAQRAVEGVLSSARRVARPRLNGAVADRWLMNARAPDKAVADLFAAMQAGGVQFFPIRHHSPACAWHLRQWVRAHRPAAVLIEGPGNLTPLVPLLLHEKPVAPVAVYATFVDKAGRLTAPGPEPAPEPPRFAAYYPFCDYSPELVALRTGHEVGARLRFIDL